VRSRVTLFLGAAAFGEGAADFLLMVQTVAAITVFGVIAVPFIQDAGVLFHAAASFVWAK
jgi:hypothetical protein